MCKKDIHSVEEPKATATKAEIDDVMRGDVAKK